MRPAALWSLISFLGLGAFALMFTGLLAAPREVLPQATGAGTTRGQLAQAARRVGVVWLGTAGLAFAVSAFVLGLLEETPMRQVGGQPVPFWRQAVLWGALSQFLGVFVHLFLAGRNLHRDDSGSRDG